MAKILLVEDNELNRDMISRRLARHGLEILTAADGPEGLEMVQALRPDLVLLDMSLPGLTGLQVVERIRAIPEIDHIPVIALTAHAISGDRERALQAGCDEYESKPVNLTRLLDKIHTLLEQTPK
jgi:two-component system cell cycle response regulator DivK